MTRFSRTSIAILALTAMGCPGKSKTATVGAGNSSAPTCAEPAPQTLTGKQPRRVIQSGHSSPIIDLAVSSTGLLASLDNSGAIGIWDPRGLVQLSFFRRDDLASTYSAKSERMGWSGNGKYLAILLANQQAILLDTEGKVVGSMPADKELVALGGGEFGRWITQYPGVESVDSDLRLVMDLDQPSCKGQMIEAGGPTDPDEAADEANNRRASIYDGSVIMSREAEDTPVWRSPLPPPLPRPVFESHRVPEPPRPSEPDTGTGWGFNNNRQGDFSNMGKRPATTGGLGSWESEPDKRKKVVATRGPTFTVLSHDKKLVIATPGDGRLVIFHSDTGRFHGELGRARVRNPTHWSLLSTGVVLRDSGRVAHWTWNDNQVSIEPAHTGRGLASRVAYGVYGRGNNASIAWRYHDPGACRGQTVRFGFATFPRQDDEVPDRVCIGENDMVIDHDRSSRHTLVATHGRDVAVYSPSSPVIKLEMGKWESEGLGAMLMGSSLEGASWLRLTPGGRYVLGFTESKAILWSSGDGKIVRELKVPKAPGETASKPSKSQVASLCGLPKLDRQSGLLGTLWTGSRRPTHLAVSQDGKVLASLNADTGSVELAELDTGKILNNFRVGPGVSALAVTDTRQLIVGTEGGSIRLFRGGKKTAETNSDGGDIRQLQVDPTRGVATTLSEDGAMRVWDLATGQLRVAMAVFDDDEFLSFSPGGAYAGTPEAADRIGWVFDAPVEAFSFERFSDRFTDPDLLLARLNGKTVDIEQAVNRPPKIQIDRAPSQTGSRAKLNLTFQSASRVDAVRVFAGGRPVASRQVCSQSGATEFVIPLLPGINRITAYAFDDSGVASNPAVTDLRGSGDEPDRPKLFVIGIGVNAYPNLPERFQLGVAEADARAIVERMAAESGTDKPFASVEKRLLVGSQVNRESILEALSVLETMSTQDLAVVFLAGHGIKLGRDKNMVFLTGQAGLGYASQKQHSVGWDQVSKHLAVAKGRTLLLLDACHSGHLHQELAVPNAQLAGQIGRDRAGVVVFAAAKGRQFSYEPNNRRGLELDDTGAALVGARADQSHGFFTGAVLEALDDGRSDRNADGSLQLSELVADVTRRVSVATGGMQTPWIARRELFGDFGVASAGAVSETGANEDNEDDEDDEDDEDNEDNEDHVDDDAAPRRPGRPAQVRLGSAQVDGSLEPMIIRRYLRRSLTRLRYCHARELQQSPHASGSVTATFTISSEGQVASSKAEGMSSAMNGCVAATIRSLRFPKPKDQGIVRITYPLFFSLE